MRKYSYYLFPMLLFALLLGGCNIFSFATPDDDAVTYLEDGREKLRDGDYDGAIEDFTKAIEQDPSNADAYWGRAKAYLRRTGFTPISLATTMSQYESEPPSLNSISELPFMDMPPAEASELYSGVGMAMLDIEVIYTGQAYSVDLNESAVRLDYVAALAVYSVLRLQDTNGDGTIQMPPDVDINFFFQFANLDPNNLEMVVEGYEDATPEELAALFGDAIDNLAESAAILLPILGDELGLDTEALNANLEELQTNLELTRDQILGGPIASQGSIMMADSKVAGGAQ